MTALTGMGVALALAGATATAAPGDAPRVATDWASAFGIDVAAMTLGGPVTTDDLLRLRDIDGLALSPDGHAIAFSVRQAVIGENEHRRRWFVMHLEESAAPIALKVDGGRPIIRNAESGAIQPEAAKWSPDGSRIAFKRRLGDRIGLVVSDVASGAAREVYPGDPQVEDFAWTDDGQLVVRTGFSASAYQAAVAKEARHGWLLDQRMPLRSARTPSPLAPDCRTGVVDPACVRQTLVIDGTGAAQPAGKGERMALDWALGPAGRLGGLAQGKVGVAAPPNAGHFAWTETFGDWPADALEPMRRVAASVDGTVRSCAHPTCEGAQIKQVGWTLDRREVWFVKATSSASEAVGPIDQMAIYAWTPGRGAPRLVRRDEALLSDCQAGNETLYCTRSSASQPTQIVAIGLQRGGIQVVCDPNPEFGSKLIPKIEKIALRDREGNPGFAYLVYPNDYRAGTRYPIVVVQYRTMGFLRGGVGAEYPIFPIAADGVFVLSTDYPVNMRERVGMESIAYQTANRVEERETRNVVYALEKAVLQQVAAGRVDQSKVAITGLSFGAEVVHQALQSSDLFTLAIASQARADITTYALLPDGMRGRDVPMRMYDETTPIASPTGRIRRLAWSQQPERLRAPLLLNLGQTEALSGFEGVATLKAAKRPIEVRVFPDEGHIKQHPQNLAGVYENNMMWLRFWFQGREDPRPEFQSQYQRWEEMRDQLGAHAAARWEPGQ